MVNLNRHPRRLTFRCYSTQDDRDAAGNLVNEHVDVSADHYKLAREIAAAGTVLLKNTRGALPLNAHDRKKWAVFGSE